MGSKIVLKILIADDDENIRSICEEVLKEAGYRVDTATNGAEALKLLDGDDYGIVITDMNMPVLDGVGLYMSAVQKRPVMKHKFLFMTGDLTKEAVALFESVDERYIQKPFTVMELLNQTCAIAARGVKELCLERRAGERTEERFGLSADCGIIEGGEENQHIMVVKATDLSRCGLKVRYAGKPLKPADVGIFINVNYMSFMRDARIIWSRPVGVMDSEAGIHFAEPLPASSIINAIPKNMA